jgi:hypothetical protein
MLSRLGGPSGALVVGAKVVATLGPWTLTHVDDEPAGTFALTAPARVVDGFWITRPPFDVRLQLGTDTLVWRDATVSVSGGHASGVVHAEQRRRHDGTTMVREHQELGAH